MVDAKLLKARKTLEESPHLTNTEFKMMMSHPNDEDNIDDLDFDKKEAYNILDHVIINPRLQAV